MSSSKKDFDILGKSFGRLTVLDFAGKDHSGHTLLTCKCSCGSEAVVQRCNLVSGKTTSCGCARKEIVSRIKTTHGGKGTRLYRVWQGMRERCSNPNHSSYYLYGERGISVCDEWNRDYDSFRAWSLANGYNDKAKRGECTLDRIDNDGGYCPENCRWVPMCVQNQNRRNHK